MIKASSAPQSTYPKESKPVLWQEGDRYRLYFPLPAAQVRWLEVHLKDRNIKVRARLRQSADDRYPQGNTSHYYEETVTLPTDCQPRNFFPLLENNHLKLTLYKERAQG